MDHKWADVFRDWHDDLIWWVRHGVPKLVVILVLAFVLIRLLEIVTRKLVELSKRSTTGAVRVPQIRTLAGVIRSFGVFLIVFITALQVLQVFAIDIKPLLASAGIAGLAIGFGAQTLVKDVINGFFILAENQFEVGETVRAAGVQGAVEEITMRRTILRDVDGTLHVVPNSKIEIVSNMTRDWSQVRLHIVADYNEDSDRVIELLHEVAQEFYNDPAFHEDAVAEPEVPGIERVTSTEVDYLMLVKVRPGRQYTVARELRRRIKVCFEKNHIKAGGPAQVFVGQLPPSKK